MEVVHDAYMVGFVVFSERFAYGDEIFRFATPATVIVKAQFAAEFSCLFNEREEFLDGNVDFGLFFFVNRTGCGMPNLGPNVVFFEKAKGFRVGAPKGEKLDVVFLVLKDLFLEFGNVFSSPIVGNSFQAKFPEHLNPLGRSPVFCVEWNNAPSD